MSDRCPTCGQRLPEMPGQLDMFDVEPEKVARRDASPAEQAAAFAKWPTAESRERVLNAIFSLDSSGEAITKNRVARRLDLSRDQVHPRMRELHLGNWIRKTGQILTDVGPHGTETGDVWELTSEAWLRGVPGSPITGS